MKLNVDLSSLWLAVKKMGAEEIDFSLGNRVRAIDPIDKALKEGHELSLDQIDFKTGLAGYEGRQVLLYIKDHSRWVGKALGDGSQGNKYHIANCSKLEEMRKKGRFDRYVVTNDLTGKFSISGQDWVTNKPLEGVTELKVCKLCLTHLNYQGYRHGNKSGIFNAFDLGDFFDKYSSFFKHTPSGVADVKNSNYTEDWPVVSQKIKEESRYICQECGVDLSENKKFLQVHHVNGVKHDNRHQNLRPLCLDCHRKQPCHTHLFISRDDTVRLTQIRRIQGINSITLWKDVYALADPALFGVINILERSRVNLPEIGFELTDTRGNAQAQLELGWPGKRICIVISEHAASIAETHGWEVWRMHDCLTHTQGLINSLKSV